MFSLQIRTITENFGKKRPFCFQEFSHYSKLKNQFKFDTENFQRTILIAKVFKYGKTKCKRIIIVETAAVNFIKHY